jgi:hypothetical protein
MKKWKTQLFDLSELKPIRLYSSELAEKGKIVILVPQRKNKFVEWLMPNKTRINDRIKLDILGSFVWNNCNGKKTVKDIAEQMKKEYGDYAEPVTDRVNNYIGQLKSNNLIDIENHMSEFKK